MVGYQNIWFMLSGKKWFWLILAILIGVLGTYPLYLPQTEKAMADVVFGLEEETSDLQIIQQTTLLPSANPPSEKEEKPIRKIRVIVTAYSSSVWETQGDPYITASGTRVRDGIVANNLLPFGTKIRLPEIFGDKIFVVEDRMNRKKGYYHVDVWFPSREAALNFGAKLTEMEILSN
jgi:3D (Asp-Asp-Asp) domain-containing protein